MISNETHKIIEERFAFPLQKYQEEVEEKIRGSEAFLYSADLLHYHLHKISLNRRGSYKDSTGQLKNKKAKINPKNKDDKCFL